MIRGLGLVLVLVASMLFLVPLQLVARARGWAISRSISLLFCRTVCRLLALRVEVRGAPSVAAARLLVANHVSWTDVMVLGSCEPVRFLAKKEVRSWPLFGQLARVQNAVFVDRSRRRGIPGVNAAMADAMEAGEPVVLFAEGTTSDGTRLLRFGSSHVAAARALLARRPDLSFVAVQPVAIAYARRDGLALGKAGRASLAWYGQMSLLPHLAARLRGGPVDCVVSYGAALSFARGTDRKVLTAEIRRAVRALCHEALGTHTPARTMGGGTGVPNGPERA